jgi:hypothetical protein
MRSRIAIIAIIPELFEKAFSLNIRFLGSQEDQKGTHQKHKIINGGLKARFQIQYV